MNNNPLNFTTCLPKIHYFGEVGSCLDTAWNLVKEGRLIEWDSAQARSQTAGRGQMRRNWISPEGNLYAALRLPFAAPFDSAAAPVALGALCANALAGLGCPVMLKWPNDLVILKKGNPAKIGGILLEERDKVLIAGIGVNVANSPDWSEMREESAMPAISLAQAKPGISLPNPDELWRALVKHIYSIYKSGPLFSGIWKNLAEEMLLWRGDTAQFIDGGEIQNVKIKGLSGTGAVILETANGIEEKYSGELRHI